MKWLSEVVHHGQQVVTFAAARVFGWFLFCKLSGYSSQLSGSLLILNKNKKTKKL